MVVMKVKLTKVNQFFASGGAGSLLKVRAQPGEDAVRERGGTLSDAVALVSGLGAVGGVVFAVELGELVEEACRNTVLVVKLDSALDRGVANYVAMCQVLGNDARPRLFLLCNLIRVTVGVGGDIGIVRGDARCRSYADVRGAQLGVVEKEGGLGGGILFCGIVSCLCGVQCMFRSSPGSLGVLAYQRLQSLTSSLPRF